MNCEGCEIRMYHRCGRGWISKPIVSLRATQREHTGATGATGPEAPRRRHPRLIWPNGGVFSVLVDARVLLYFVTKDPGQLPWICS